MLQNLTNFFNLIKTRKIKTQLDNTDLIAVGTADPTWNGGYQPTAITYEDLAAQIGGGAISLTTSGISGPASLTGTILNIPDYFVYKYEIGEYVPSQGGVIFHRYKDGTNENYLVVDTTNVSSSLFWSNINNVSIGATARSTWDGLSNSDAIVAQVGFTSGAAKSCLDSTNNGQTDWYLPAIDELSLLWQNRFNVNRTLSGNSSFGSIPGATQIGYNHSYWSSTEYDGTGAWFFGFGGGSAYIGNKNANQFVRAVRKISLPI